MLSRVADAVFWMSRYMERAENVARFIDVNLHLMLDAIDTGSAQWEPLVAITGDNGLFRARYGSPSRESVIRFLTFDAEYGNSIVSCLRAARDNARSVREIISSEMWEQVNTAYLTVQEGARHPDRVMESPHDFFTAVKKASQLFVGITYLTMTHNEAWHFGRLGRLLERADKTSRIVDVKYFILLRAPSEVGSTFDEVQWAALLKSASGFEMYRKRFGRIVPANVVDFLLFDRKFPRSVRYCLVKSERSLHAVTGSTPGAFTNPAEQLLGRLRSDIEFGDVHEAIQSGLHDYIDRFQLRINEVGGAIHDTFFALQPVEHELRVDRDLRARRLGSCEGAGMSGWLRDTWWVLEKDLRIERRTGEIVTTSGFFAVLIVVIASMALNLSSAQAMVAPGVMWISIAFAAVLALGRSWHREREESALIGLLVSPLRRSSIFAGKALGILLFLITIELLVVPTTALLFALDLPKIAPGLVLISLVATPGIAATGTLFGAMTARTRARDLILAAVLFPLLAPTLLTAVAATRELVSGTMLIDLGDFLLLMGAFDLVFILGGLSLFGALVEG